MEGAVTFEGADFGPDEGAFFGLGAGGAGVAVGFEAGFGAAFTPVGFGEEETDFLLVPELGACIHVPPPSPNQIVLVEKPQGSPEMFAPVWVTGTLRADPTATILADAGYRIDNAVTEPYR